MITFQLPERLGYYHISCTYFNAETKNSFVASEFSGHHKFRYGISDIYSLFKTFLLGRLSLYVKHKSKYCELRNVPLSAIRFSVN